MLFPRVRRVLKFKAWDKRNKKFIENYKRVLPSFYEGKKYDVKTGGGRNHLNVYVQNDFGEDCMLLLWTGLKDINGKEIYEGDIVKVIFWSWDKETHLYAKYIEKGVVEWVEFKCGFMIKTGKDRFIDLFIGEFEFEVVGNIFEDERK